MEVGGASGSSGSAGSGGASGGAAGTGGATAGCNDFVAIQDWASCAGFTGEPAHSGGVIPEGTYRLAAWTYPSNCPYAVRQAARITQTAPNNYTTEYVADWSNAPGWRRSNSRWSTNGTELMSTVVCGGSQTSVRNYSVLEIDGSVTLRISNSTAMDTYVRTGD